MIPITISSKDFGEFIRARRNKRLQEWTPKDKDSQQISIAPKQISTWQADNNVRLITSKTTPQFIEQNKGLLELRKKQKELIMFAGTLQMFADELFKTGRSIGMVKQIGRIDDIVRNDMAKRKAPLLTETIIVLDKSVLKYIGHPKATKGATVDPLRYSEIETTINAPEHIYEDLNSKELVYVYTHPYETGKIIKVVVHPNYKYKGVVTNVAKSWGVVENKQMDMPIIGN